MKILMVCTENLPVPPVLGGAIQTYISGSLPYLSKNHEITVIGISDPTLPNEEVMDGVKYVRVPGRALELYREGVVQFIEANQFDLIHIFNRPRLVLPVRKVAPKSKITLSMHNDMFNFGKIDPNEASQVIEEVSGIVTISNYVGNVIRELYPAASDKIRTIYSGVDTDRFLSGNDSKMSSIRNSLRKEHGLENKTVILFAGRLSENKGVDRLIRALPQLSSKFNNLALVVVGSNWFSQNHVTDYVAYIRAISKKQQVPVITTGFVSPYEMQNWFAVADLFVCTSLWQEPLARVHYEAMAAGLPIVTTARGGNAEVILPGENGLIVENPDDPAEFADKITQILSNKSLMRNMGKIGRELAVTNYVWSRVASDILDVWSKAEFSSSITAEQFEQFESNQVVRTVVPVEIKTKTVEEKAKETFEEVTFAEDTSTEETFEEVYLKDNQAKVNTVKKKLNIEEVLAILEQQKINVENAFEKELVIRDEQEWYTPKKLKPIRSLMNSKVSKYKVSEEKRFVSEPKVQAKREYTHQSGLRRIISLKEMYNQKNIS